jgi:hypothetical protein
MIEVVTEADLDLLGSIGPHERNGRMRAAGILTDIIRRLPRPRAYISEPTYMAHEPEASLWCLAYDMLSAQLKDAGTSVIEPETVRDIALFCSVLEKLTDALDPLWQALVAGKLVDAVYIPSDGENSQRHAAMRRISRSLGIQVYGYRPQTSAHRQYSQPSRTI